MAIPTGLYIDVISQGGTAGAQYVCLAGHGTYTAADFTITPEAQYTNNNAPTLATQQTFAGLGFAPKKVRLLNLTDKTSMEHFYDSDLGTANVEGLKTVANGTRTYEASGLSVAGRSLTVDVSVALITDNDDFIIECWG
jgi:hypothetical protein